MEIEFPNITVTVSVVGYDRIGVSQVRALLSRTLRDADGNRGGRISFTPDGFIAMIAGSRASELDTGIGRHPGAVDPLSKGE